MIKTGLFILLGLAYSMLLVAQKGRIYNLRNCQGEMRTVTFQHQVNLINRCVQGRANIRQQKVVSFAPDYKFDTAAFEVNIMKLRKKLPHNFLNGYDVGGDWLNNNPDEPAIWFNQVFALKDNSGNFTVYAAINIIFDGTDAKDDRQRMLPHIRNVEFIFDPTELKDLANRLKSSSTLGE